MNFRSKKPKKSELLAEILVFIIFISNDRIAEWILLAYHTFYKQMENYLEK